MDLRGPPRGPLRRAPPCTPVHPPAPRGPSSRHLSAPGCTDVHSAVARQAGGHWFEPSTAHPTPTRCHVRCRMFPRVRCVGDAARAHAVQTSRPRPLPRRFWLVPRRFRPLEADRLRSLVVVGRERRDADHDGLRHNEHVVASGRALIEPLRSVTNGPFVPIDLTPPTATRTR